jgi:hypothetical protein
VLVDSQTVDEATTARPTAGAAAVASEPTEEPLGDQHPGMVALYREPYLTYRELEPGDYGGRVEILGADGRLLAWAEGDGRSTGSGLLVKNVTVFLTGVDGARLGYLRRAQGLLGETHSLYDESNQCVGQFSADFTADVSINTNRGGVGVIRYGEQQSTIVTPTGVPLVRCVYQEVDWGDSSLNFSSPSLRAVRRPDTYVLERLGPVPAWLFLFALWMPIEANLHLDIVRRI